MAGKIRFVAVLGVVSFLAATGPASPPSHGQGPAYVLVDLGSAAYMARDINNSGHVVGEGGNIGAFPFLFQDGVLQNLGSLGGGQGTALGINEAGEVVGGSFVAGGNQFHAFLYRNGVMVDLGPLPGGAGGVAWEIDDRGEIAGTSSSGAAPHAFRWSNGVIKDLGDLGGLGSYATAINNRGQIIGFSNPPQSRTLYRAFVWQKGDMMDLGTLGGDYSFAYDINNKGHIVGTGEHAFLWRRGMMQDLGTLGGRSTAFGINNRRQVVGTSLTPGGGGIREEHAFLWRNGRMTDLNAYAPPGWTFAVARAINDVGQIVGYGPQDGNLRAFFLTPQ